MNKSRLTALILVTAQLIQPLAYAADSTGVAKAHLQYQVGYLAARDFVGEEFRERFQAMEVGEQHQFLDQTEKYMGRLENRLERISSRKFKRRTKMVARVLEKKMKKEALTAEDGAEEGLIDAPRNEMQAYFEQLQKLAGTNDPSAEEKSSLMSREQTKSAVSGLRGLSRKEALETVSEIRTQIGTLKVAMQKVKLDRMPANDGLGAVFGVLFLLIFGIFLFFIPTGIFIVAAIITGSVALWILAAVSIGISFWARSQLTVLAPTGASRSGFVALNA